ncbi:hypothetical protein BCON_0291g00090 [Botryotinia convoluta]|uniref:Uncharacterized protein n=1 Tax=Botryotinia convoluta TaxID=54673 RepID=A0A4Z1HD70_9HELO|nr:hypothetical protein BCON_0291g00090 [Botryotinia convoluta]
MSHDSQTFSPFTTNVVSEHKLRHFYVQLAIVASSQESNLVTLPSYEDVQVIVSYKTLCDPFDNIQQVQLLRIQIFDITGCEIFYYQELVAKSDPFSGWNRYHGRDPGPPPPPFPPQQPFPPRQQIYQLPIAHTPVVYPSSLQQ